MQKLVCTQPQVWQTHLCRNLDPHSCWLAALPLIPTGAAAGEWGWGPDFIESLGKQEK